MLKQLCSGSMSRRSTALLLVALCGCDPVANTEEEDPFAQETTAVDGGTRTPSSSDGGFRFPSFDGGFTFPSRSRDAGVVDAGPPNVIPLTDADGVTGQVTASGKGCPLGAWDVKMSDDQLTYTATFKSMSVTLAAAQEVSTIACTLSIAPPSDGTRQFSAERVTYSAKGKFDKDVVGALEVRHYYQGSAANTLPGHVFEVGPFDGALEIEREIGAGEARWTPCGAPQRGVNVDLLLRLSNGYPRATGNLAGDADSKLVITLMDRACPVRDAGTPSTGN